MGDAHAGIVNGQAQPLTMALHADGHIALGGEFDGVADQIDQALTQARAICLHPQRNRQVRLGHDLQPLGLGHRRGECSDITDQRVDIRGCFTKLDLARARLGEIENIVDDIQQGRGG